MGIFSKLFQKRKQAKSSDNFNVVLYTKKNLSEEQKNAIISIVKNGNMSGIALSDISIQIMMSTGIYNVIILNRIKDGIEGIFCLHKPPLRI